MLQQVILSDSVLIRKSWSFGPYDGDKLTSSFCFGSSGRIEGYSHRNEATWALDGHVVTVFDDAGRVMWRSERIFFDQDGLVCITLRTPVSDDALFVLVETHFEANSWRPQPASNLSAADFLFPKELQLTSTRPERILLIGSCLTALYRQELSRLAEGVVFDYLIFNFAGSLPPEPPAPPGSYDFQYIQIPIRSVLSDRIIWATRFNEPGFAEQILTDARGIIDVMLESAMQYNATHGILTFVTNFFVPQMSVASSLALRNTSVDLAAIVRSLNDYVAEVVGRFKNAYLLDTNAVADSIGKRYLMDDQIYFYSHGAIHFQEPIDLDNDLVPRVELIPLIDTFYESKQADFVSAVYDQMIAAYRTVNQVDQVKAVVFDLDNTLWRGQLAEHYRPGQPSHPKTDGWPLGIWEAIHQLRARGILVAVCSKNDQKTVEEYWDSVVQPKFLSLSDFVSVKINWLPKAENIQAIIQEFNLKPKSVVFVDDNPVERASVKAALPDIRVIGANPYLTRRILLWAPETQVAFLTNEATQRENMVRNQIVREESRSAMTRDEFLTTLQCTVTFMPITSVEQPEFGRVIELTNKTNQFNTTAKRWTHSEINQFLAAGGEILAFSVTDKFSEYGLVGVLYIEGTIIRQYVMSCRVLGMEVEEFVVARAVDLLRRKSGPSAITAPLKETPDNNPCREVFVKSGFTLIEQAGGTRLYRLEVGQDPKRPKHIRPSD
jgi:FkbH-like protein